MAVTIRGRGPTALESNVGSVAKRIYCRYDGCTGEALTDDEEIFLCTRHTSMALNMFQSAWFRLTYKSPAELADETEQIRREVRAAAAVENVKGAVVYYVMLNGLVKIGTSTNLKARLSSYQIAFDSDALLAYEPGGYGVEKLRHKQFWESRVRNELFRPDPELMEHIAEIKAKQSASAAAHD